MVWVTEYNFFKEYIDWYQISFTYYLHSIKEANLSKLHNALFPCIRGDNLVPKGHTINNQGHA